MARQDEQSLRKELDALEATVSASSVWTSLDASARAQYLALTKKLCDQVWADYQAGRISAEDGALIAAPP